MCHSSNGDILDQIHRLIHVLKIPDAFRGKDIIDQEGIIAETLSSGSTAANPREATDQDVRIILETLFLAG